MPHIPVLLQEVIDGLQAREGETILDATVGGGGHSEALCQAVGGKATFVCLDADEDAIRRSKKRLAVCGCSFHFYQSNFRHLDAALQAFGVKNIHRALFDLGLSSFQFEESGRGFSFQRNESLMMTFARDAGPDERAAGRIAGAIVRARGMKRITTTAGLREIVERAAPRRGKIHPATRTFQALRMAVNDGLGALPEGRQKP